MNVALIHLLLCLTFFVGEKNPFEMLKYAGVLLIKNKTSGYQSPSEQLLAIHEGGHKN